MTAAQRIRDSIAALPGRAGRTPWVSDDAGNLFAAPDTSRRHRNKAWVGELDGAGLAA